MSKVKMISAKEFSSAIKSGNVLVKIGAEWCGPCKVQHVILEKVAEKIGDKASIVEIDADKCIDVCKQMSIQSVPTMILFKGGKESKRLTGLTKEDALLKLLE